MSKKSILFWDVMSLLFIIGVPSITCIWIGVWPSGVELVKSMISIAILFYPAAILSAIPYISTIGLYGTYLSFVTGNVSNIKLPCALNALSFLGENSSQDHKDCMVTVAVTISNIVTLIVLAICVFGLFPYITDVMDLPIAPAFRQILAALFGALGVSCFTKNKIFSVILVVCLVFFLIIDGTLSSTTLLVIAMSIIMVYSIVVSIIKYNKNNQREESK
ncbi:MAG: hypothetical protein IJZ16_10965 [Clostridia bacterium]|nr:hypothetical protein [Clostridia bacterium]